VVVGCGRWGCRQCGAPVGAYGDELRRRREAAGLTQQALADAVVCSPSLVAHYEAGRRRPQTDDARRLDLVLGTDGFFERFLGALEPQFAEHFAPVAELEPLATVIQSYAATLVPGILQTPAYARAVLRADQPNCVPEEVDERVVNRRRRGVILDRPAGPVMWVVMSENVLRTVVGGPVTMAEQLRHIAVLGRSGRVLVQVVPHAIGAHATMGSMLTLMGFTDAPDIAYVEGLHTGRTFEDPTRVARYRTAYDLARAAALAPEPSLDMIEAVAEEYEHGRERRTGRGPLA
jgi:transcriptional regulator with XRE-family HTH domain